MNQATLHVKKIVNSNVQMLHLCDACAAIIGLSDCADSDADLAELIFDVDNQISDSDAGAEDAVSAECAICGLSLEDFRTTGRFGCERCYMRFGDVLRPGLTKMHRGISHTGKAPKDNAPAHTDHAEQLYRMTRLREELARAVASEEYETAAALRDEISNIRGSHKGR